MERELKIEFRIGDRIEVTEYIKNEKGKIRAHIGEKGYICNKHGEINGKTSIHLDGKKYPIHDVWITFIRLLPKQTLNH